jgi:hypothetical protein
MLDAGYWIWILDLDAGYLIPIPDTGYKIQDTGYRMQDARCKIRKINQSLL